MLVLVMMLPLAYNGSLKQKFLRAKTLRLFPWPSFGMHECLLGYQDLTESLCTAKHSLEFEFEVGCSFSSSDPKSV